MGASLETHFQSNTMEKIEVEVPPGCGPGSVITVEIDQSQPPTARGSYSARSARAKSMDEQEESAALQDQPLAEEYSALQQEPFSQRQPVSQEKPQSSQNQRIQQKQPDGLES